MSRLDEAIKVATIAHAEQKDKAGDPYIWHVLRVANEVRYMGGDEDAQIVALLHDTVEDGHLTLEGIKVNFGAQVRAAVEALTRLESDSGKMPRYDYETYIYRVAKNPIAVEVKIADLKDNMDMTRIPGVPTITDWERWGRYHWAERLLQYHRAFPDGIAL